MAKYHLNKKGEPGVCRAQHSCPFGDADRHYGSPEDARVAYEISQMAATVPGGATLEDPTRKKLGLPALADPAVTGVDPDPRAHTAQLMGETVERARTAGRKVFEASVGGRTYPIGFRNERAGLNPEDIHLIEADRPWNAPQKEAFDKFIEETGLTYEVRQSRVSVFKPMGSVPQPSFDERLAAAAERNRKLSSALGRPVDMDNLFKAAKKAQSKLDEMPEGADLERARRARARDEARDNWIAANVNLASQDETSKAIIEGARKVAEASDKLEMATRAEAAKRSLATRLGIDKDRVDMTLMRTGYQYRDLQRSKKLTLSELSQDTAFVTDTANRLRISDTQVRAILTFADSADTLVTK